MSASFAKLAIVALALVPIAAGAQAWPAKPIRWVVPYPPGGSTDVATRALADRLAQALGVAVIVDNRAGAAGVVGTDFVAKSAPDGYTLLSGTDAMGTMPHVSKLPFDPIKDFVAITQMSRQPVVIAAHPSAGVTSIAELVSAAKGNPTKFSYATSGAASQQHLVGELLAKQAGIRMTHIPYKGGGQAISDLVGGQVPIASLGSTPLIPHYKAGKIRLLAVSTRSRAPTLPEVPALAEQGFTDFHIEQWLGVFAPTGTPREIVGRLHAELVKALQAPEVRARYDQAALEPVGSSPEAFTKLLQDDFTRYASIIRELGIKLE